MPLITKYVRETERLVGKLERDCRNMPAEKLDALIRESAAALRQEKTLTMPWKWAAYIVNDWATFELALRSFKSPQKKTYKK